MTADRITATRDGRLRVSRSRGAVSGVLLVLLGAWGALVPFIGPAFDFGYTPDKSWTWTAARGWLEVLPGAVVVVGGLLLLVSANRVLAALGACLAVAGGAWFIVGPQLADLLNIGAVGTPARSGTGMRALEALSYFYALGAIVLFLAAAAFGRLSIRSVSDVQAAQARTAATRDDVLTPQTPAYPASGYGDDAVSGQARPGEDLAAREGTGRAAAREQNTHPHRHFGRRQHRTDEAAPDGVTSSDSAAPRA
jgi:hypothetical protein